MNKNAVIYIHGKGGNISEAEHYKPLFPDCDVIGLDYKSATPWEFRAEVQSDIAELTQKYDNIILIANSIGAYFAMNVLSEKQIKCAFFISPIVNMEKLISDMMIWANVSEELLREKRIIKTDFGEDLSWEYLEYARNNPITWNVPTVILYGEHDNLTSIETITEFAKDNNAGLTVMKDGEHRFHTDEQMAYLDKWIEKNM